MYQHDRSVERHRYRTLDATKIGDCDRVEPWTHPGSSRSNVSNGSRIRCWNSSSTAAAPREEAATSLLIGGSLNSGAVFESSLSGSAKLPLGCGTSRGSNT